MEEPLAGRTAGALMAVGVTVALPAIFKVTLKARVPPARAALDGRPAFASDEVMPTASVALVSRFQLASTALTVTLKAVPAVCAMAAPVLPVALPGAAVSPGARTCSFARVPMFTPIAGLVFAVMPECVMSDAVIVPVPAVLRVMLQP